MPSAAAIRTALSMGPEDTVPGDPESLVPLARINLARSRQQMLSTMVMMGLQRIVIESGRLNAAMRFHIDTRSAANDDRGSSFDFRNDTTVGVGAKVGPWGVEGKMQNTVGYVSTERTQTTEEMNTELDLNSSVELILKTDYVALDRLAGGPAQERIRVNALNPEAEANLASSDRQARRTAQGASESARSGKLADRLQLPTQGGAIPANAPTPPAAQTQTQTQTPTPPAAQTPTPPPQQTPTPTPVQTPTPPGAQTPTPPAAQATTPTPAPPVQHDPPSR